MRFSLAVLASLVVARGDVVRLNRDRLRDVADTLGVLNFIEEAPEAGLSPLEAEAESFAAAPADLDSGNFEIKCQTSCGFVKSGTFTTQKEMSGAGKAALEAAQELAKVQDELKGVQAELLNTPGDGALQAKEIQLQSQVQDKVQALQAAAGLPQSASGMESSAVSLANAKKKLEQSEKRLEDQGPSAELEASIELEKAEVKKFEALLKAQKNPDVDLESNIAKMKKRLAQLKAALSAKPDDPALKDEISTVEKALENKAKEQGYFSPKTSCSRVCMDKVHHEKGEDVQQGAPSKSCMRMCVKVMQHLVFHMMSGQE